MYLIKCDAPVQPSNTPGGTDYMRYSITLSQALDKQMQQSPQIEKNGVWVTASSFLDACKKYCICEVYAAGHASKGSFYLNDCMKLRI